MRIWSLHPKYLDTKGLVALWGDAILAKSIFEEKILELENHPQLIRFKNIENPVDSINQYLSHVYKEAYKRGFNFNKNKIEWNFDLMKINVTKGQIEYEVKHLLNKLKIRDRKKYLELFEEEKFCPNPIFKIVEGGIEEWEVIEKNQTSYIK